MSMRPGFAFKKYLFAQKYTFQDLVKDVQAGITVGIVAIPLAVAFAIATGVAPQFGLYTVVVAGFLTPLLGGSRFQVTGPTAAFIAILLPVGQQYGVGGLLTAGFLAGIILVLFSIFELGRVIQFIPYPVTQGFTSGIAVVIFSLQVLTFLGIPSAIPQSDVFANLTSLVQNFSLINVLDVAVGSSTLVLIILSNRYFKKAPAPVVAITIMTIAVYVINLRLPDLEISTVASAFGADGSGGIPKGLPHFVLPWHHLGAEGHGFDLDFTMIKTLLPVALSIALLSAITSLLSAVVADGMTGEKHEPNSELFAQGISNIVGAFLCCIPSSGAVARTTTNIRYGAKTPIAASVHALIVLVGVLFFADSVNHLPMASLAALLMFIAFNMFDFRHFINVFRLGDRPDKMVLLTVFGLTVVFDMVIGVGVGVLLAALLLIKRVSQLTDSANVLEVQTPTKKVNVPKETFYFRIAGPLFFGATQRALKTIETVPGEVTKVVIDLTLVSFTDTTGLVALDSILGQLRATKKRVVLVCPPGAMLKDLRRMDNFEMFGAEFEVVDHLDKAF